MLKTKLFTAIALVAALLLLAPAAYAAEDTASGQFAAQGQAPTVTAIQIFTDSGCTIIATSMTPLTTYYARVSVTSNNKLKNLDTVQAQIFYDSTGGDPVAPDTPDTHTCAILTCTVSGPSWAIASGGPPTTWSIVELACVQPANLNLTSGNWIFAFKPGKVATENTGAANWDAQGKATNKQAQSDDEYVRDKDMNFYGELTVGTPSVNWGSVDLGLIFSDEADSRETGISVNYIANGNYEEDIKSEDWDDGGGETLTLRDWSDDDNPPDAASEFALKGNDINALVSAITVTTVYKDTDDTGTMTEEAGDTIATNTLWLSLSASGILPGTYTGDIYYQITDR
ncbi:MAG: hypothetical protein MUO97_03590 [Dehalococcoidia bacterium]|nr:hypothetical protein [Dehalococcoidia bacterium]